MPSSSSLTLAVSSTSSALSLFRGF
uniref:Uncharacterized protein n=1 Tax=Arundo donax TaxID=35708 RepID=A0A0A8ZUP9_ARUDO